MCDPIDGQCRCKPLVAKHGDLDVYGNYGNERLVSSILCHKELLWPDNTMYRIDIKYVHYLVID